MSYRRWTGRAPCFCGGPGRLNSRVTIWGGGCHNGAVPPPILLTVDDDPEVSRSLARDLRQQYGEDYRIRRAESGTPPSTP